jgi:hypothetical protein
MALGSRNGHDIGNWNCPNALQESRLGVGDDSGLLARAHGRRGTAQVLINAVTGQMGVMVLDALPSHTDVIG